MTEESQKKPLQNGGNSSDVNDISLQNEAVLANNDTTDKSVNNDSAAIPTNLSENLNNFQDVPRDEDPIYISEVVQDTNKATNIAIDESSDSSSEEIGVDPNLELDSGLDSFLEQLDISKRQFFGFLAVILILLVGVGFSFYFLFKYFSNSSEQVKIVGEVQIEEKIENSDSSVLTKVKNSISNLNPFKKDESVDSNDVTDDDTKTKVESDKNNSQSVTGDSNEQSKDNIKTENVDTSVGIVNKIAKLEILNKDSRSLIAVKKIGKTEISENRLSFYLRTYRKVRNIYNTDLFSYLSQVTNRNNGFDLFLIQFKGANAEAILAYDELRQEIAEYQARVKKLQEDASLIENQFFNSLDQLESEVIATNLQAFQDISQKRAIATAELKARESIAAKFNKALPLIAEKIAAIEVNKDAFVKGVKVVDFRQVDLDLIIKQ